MFIQGGKQFARKGIKLKGAVKNPKRSISFDPKSRYLKDIPSKTLQKKMSQIDRLDKEHGQETLVTVREGRIPGDHFDRGNRVVHVPSLTAQSQSVQTQEEQFNAAPNAGHEFQHAVNFLAPISANLVSLEKDEESAFATQQQVGNELGNFNALGKGQTPQSRARNHPKVREQQSQNSPRSQGRKNDSFCTIL